MQIPRFDEGARLRGRAQQNRTTRASADDFDGVRGGLQNLAQGVSTAAEALDIRDAVHAEAESREALNKFRDSIRSNLYDPQDGYLNQEGGNALSGTRDATQESIQQARERIRDGLSPRAQRAFDKQADELHNRTKDVSIQHEGAELKNYTRAQLTASAQGYIDDALMEPDRQDLFTESVSQAEQEVRRLSALDGDSPEVLQQKLDGVQDAAHSGRIVAIANNDPVAAWDYLQENRDRLDPGNYDKLHDQLKPLWNAARAREWVADNNIRSGTNRFAKLGIPSFIYTPESGGDVNAWNAMGSGAGGVVQFMPDTYLGLVKRMQQDGAAAWSVGMTDEQILKTRFGEENLERTAEVYREFRSNNQDQLRAGDVPVTPRTEYMAHHLGATGAVSLFNTARAGGSSKTMKQHLIETIGARKQEMWFKQNPWMRGKTVGGALDWFARKTDTENVRAPGAAMAEAANIEDPELRSAVMQELNTRIAAEETQKSTELAEANEEAWDIIDKGGTASDIPADLAVRVGISTMNEIMNAQERRMQGVDQNDFNTYEELDALSKDPESRDQFLNTDLNDHRDRLSQQSFIQFRDLQREMQQEREQIRRDGLSSVVFPVEEREKAVSKFEDRFMAMMGGKTDELVATRWPDLQRQFRGMLTRYANENGAPPPPNEQQSMFDTLMLPAVLEDDPDGGMFSNPDRRLFDVARYRRSNEQGVEIEADTDDLGAEDFRRISAEFKRTFGRQPTEDEVVEQFENEVLLSVGIEPSIEFDEIPQDVRRKLVDEFPDGSEQTWIEIYKRLIVDTALADNP